MRLAVLIVAGVADLVALLAFATGLELGAAVALIAVANTAALLAQILPRRRGARPPYALQPLTRVDAERAALGDLLRGASVEQTCGACPAQWEGTLADGRLVYVRYRHGWLAVGLGDTLEEAVERAMDDRVEFLAQLGDENDGWLTWDEVLQAVGREP